MKCEDCDGRGEYQGWYMKEPGVCETCDGHGELDASGEKLKSIILANLPDWMQDPHYIDKLGKITGSSQSNKLEMNDVVYIYDKKWREGQVTHIEGGFITILYQDRGACYLSGPLLDVCWNITQNRWEYIFIGTPKW